MAQNPLIQVRINAYKQRIQIALNSLGLEALAQATRHVSLKLSFLS